VWLADLVDLATRGPGGRVGAAVLGATILVGCGDATEPDEATPPPGAASDEEVMIAADGLELVGTLRRPDGSHPHPAVVVAHGSGPQSRRGLAPGQLGLALPQPIPVYEQLAEGLRAAGYAVLTFDKRSCGPFNGCADNGYPAPPDDLTFDTFVDDVGAALDHLRTREDIDEVIVLGHSKGGTIAADLAATRSDLAAVVLLATPVSPIDEVLEAQADTFASLVEAAGQQGTAADAAVAQVRDLAAQVADVAGGEVDGPPIGGASRGFWASWIEAGRAAPDRIASAEAPVLVLGGEHDWNVPPEQLEGWRPSLGDDDRIEVLPDITHALTRLGTGDPAALTPADVGTQVEPSVVSAVARWLDTVRQP
jgi:uncharacterized protein